MAIHPASVRLAKTSGFCMGVKRAVEMAIEVIRRKRFSRVYSYGPLIHNPQTLELLAAQGIEAVDDLDAIEPGPALIIIRAHGIAPEEKRKIVARGFDVLDATCPRVTHVQSIISKHCQKGYDILIVGDKNHPEVNGLLGCAEGRGQVIGDCQEALAAPLPEQGKLCVVAQTTQDLKHYADIIEALKSRHPDTLFFQTICDSTEKRQVEVSHLAREMDAMIIVGGRNSANTTRLAELSRQEGAETFHVETAAELEDAAIGRFDRIGIAAGASTPNWIIDQVVDRVATGRQQKRGLGNFCRRIWIWLIRNDIYAALGAAALTLAGATLIGAGLKMSVLLVASLYVYGMHRLNRYFSLQLGGGGASFPGEKQIGSGKVVLVTSLGAIAAAMGISYWIGSDNFLLLVLISIFGILYHAPLFPASFRFPSLKTAPGSKNFSVALAWATVAVISPALGGDYLSLTAVVVSFLFIFYLVFARSVISDLRDIQNDRMKGIETLPVVLGLKAVRRLIVVSSFFVATALIFAGASDLVSGGWLLLPLCIFYLWICLALYDRAVVVSWLVMEGLLESNYIFAGVLTLIWLFLG